MRYIEFTCTSTAFLLQVSLAGCSSNPPDTNTGGSDAGVDSAGGSGGAGAGGNGGSAGSAGAAGNGECQTSVDCEGRLPQTTPAGCAEAECDPLAQKCIFRAKDADGDGHAAAKCSAVGGGTIKTGDDCDDADPDSYPGAWDGPGDGVNQPDRCDAIDQDCDGNADDDPVGGRSCTCDPANPPACNETSDGQAIAGLNSTTAGVAKCQFGVRECVGGSLGACVGAIGPKPETCDDEDNDCDGETDEDANNALSWFKDADGDGFGDENTPPRTACKAPAPEWKSNIPNTDCDDTFGIAHPGALETCGDTLDANCDPLGLENDGYQSGACEVGLGACREEGGWVCEGLYGIRCDATPGTPTSEYLESPINGSWDGNCDGMVELEFQARDSCGAISDEMECGRTGYSPNSNPACGSSIARCVYSAQQCRLPSHPSVVKLRCK